MRELQELLRPLCSNPSEIGLQLTEALLARPNIQRQGGQLIDLRNRAGLHLKVDAMEIGRARLTGLDLKVVVTGRAVIGQLLLRRFAA